MTPSEIEELSEKVAEKTAKKAISGILLSLGIDDTDHKELRADFVHLRKWRQSVESVQNYTFKAIVTTIVGGFLGALWLGVSTFLHK